MLLFKKKFLDAIREGRKAQTIRLWKHRQMKAGQRSYIPGVGYIRIEAVEPVALAELDDEDARLDGFDSAGEMHTELQAMYPDQIAAGYQAFRVTFAILPPAEQHKLAK